MQFPVVQAACEL